MPSTVPSESASVPVVAAVVEDRDGSILLARRPDDKHQGGKWEFPGGKIEPNESGFDALVRELEEEVGIVITEATRLIRVPYRYPDKRVSLDVWQVQKYQGKPHGREGQPVRWVRRDELASQDFPPANRAIVAALTLPHLYAISDFQRYGTSTFFKMLETALVAGLQLFQLREHTLNKTEFLKLATRVVELCHTHNARVLLNCDPAWLGEVPADGIHLTEKRLLALLSRPLPEPYLVAASCHDRIALQHAEQIGADFAVLSPIKPTRSHADARPIGWKGFYGMVAETGIPVFALGGLSLNDFSVSRDHGAQGLAMISGLWESERIGLAETYD
jgi:8-oxo-dGTP diphosphatase